MKKFFEDFKKFITRGNVVDMAVGVAVASAFTAIVTAFTKGFISPLLALITGNSSLDTMTWVIKDAVLDEAGEIATPAVEILWGSFLQRAIDFIIIAFVLFLVMRIANTIISHSAKVRQNMINALTDADEIAAAEAEKAAAKAAEEALMKAEAEKAAAAAAEAKIKAEEERRAKEIELLSEIRDLLKKQ